MCSTPRRVNPAVGRRRSRSAGESGATSPAATTPRRASCSNYERHCPRERRAHEAFEILRALSQNTNVKLRDMARRLIEEAVPAQRPDDPSESPVGRAARELPSAAS
ncbi:ANTAR domain-containing protein [Amycolatopsis sp. NPDC051372]|uniref:ANTAR domain-containing protein n=1 Tax=Amycolatopsis sp. NPDC051372 TaxID=3155669 RepID=UPI0034444777